jgi:hypothetical protein
MYIKILQTITKLDGAVLKSDPTIIKLLKRKIFKPIGYKARKILFTIKYS